MTEPTEEQGMPLEEVVIPDESIEELDPSSEETQGENEEDNDAKVRRAADVLNIGLPTAEAGGAPPWVLLPTGLKFPRGKQVLFVKFKSSWTDAPWKGESIVDAATGETEVDANGKEVLYRQCIIWPINTADKKLAYGRAQRDPNRAADELAKQMMRAHDGIECDWGVVRANGVEAFWNELGEKCRGLLLRIFTQLHVLDTSSTSDFLTNCIEVRSTGS